MTRSALSLFRRELDWVRCRKVTAEPFWIEIAITQYLTGRQRKIVEALESVIFKNFRYSSRCLHSDLFECDEVIVDSLSSDCLQTHQNPDKSLLHEGVRYKA